MEELCPDATLLQYVNPMAINCWAIKERFPNIKTVGLCHSVQETAHELAGVLNVDPNALNYRCGGINHVAFYTNFELVNADGTREDLYPRLKQMAQDRTYPEYDEVRFDMLRRVGHFVTESSMHFSEYNSWYLKATHPGIVEKNQLRIGEYLYRCEDQIAEWRELQKELEGDTPMEVCRSNEYAAGIIEGIVTGVPQTIWGNVPNNGLIPSLPNDCIVEVPCHVDRNGINPMRADPMPSVLTSIMGQSIAVQREVVNAAITGKKDSIYHAAMLDPHTSGELTLDQTTAMVDELLQAHHNWLPRYS
jgi:alpha-galactosidase